MAIDNITCNGNGEVSVEDIMIAINALIDQGVDFQQCCDAVGNRSFIRTLQVDNKLYITDDGSQPVEI